MNLSEKLVSLRKQKGFTQMDLAERLDVSRQAISRWEVGAAVPSIDNLKVLSELYEVPVDYLLNSSEIDICRNNINQNQVHIGKGGKGTISKRLVIFVGVLIILAAAVFVICIMKTHRQDEVKVIPIGEMDNVAEDYSAVDTFSIG